MFLAVQVVVVQRVHLVRVKLAVRKPTRMERTQVLVVAAQTVARLLPVERAAESIPPVTAATEPEALVRVSAVILVVQRQRTQVLVVAAVLARQRLAQLVVRVLVQRHGPLTSVPVAAGAEQGIHPRQQAMSVALAAGTARVVVAGPKPRRLVARAVRASRASSSSNICRT